MPLKYTYNNPKSPNIELYFITNYAWNIYCTILEKMRVMVKLDFWMFFTAYFIKDRKGHFIDSKSYDTLWAINNFYKKDMGDQMQ